MKSASVNVILALAATAAASPAGNIFKRTGCNADNCLRAIRNTARPGLPDCASYLQATVTPATSTVFTTLSFTDTATNTIDVTITNTELATATVYDEQTATEVVTNGITVKPWKRQATEVPSAIPAYASPCSGAVRYSSACACLGATATTITVATPTTTITVSETTTATVDEYRTVQTDIVTVTDNTETITTVVATQTVVSDHPVATVSDFKLRVKSYPHRNKYIDYVPNHSGNGAGVAKFGNPAQADRFTISAQGTLVAPNGKVLNYPVPVNHNGLATIETYVQVPSNRQPLTCQINTVSKELECAVGVTPGGFVDCTGRPEPQWWTGRGQLEAGCVPLSVAVEY